MDKNNKTNVTGFEIAVIGMSGRFSGAMNIHDFWADLEKGKELICFISDEELNKVGVEPELLKNKNYVRAGSFLDDIEYFDASFFGYTPKEAEILNPQIRIFYECVYEALEDAGYALDKYNGLIGLYAGASINMGWDALTYFSGKMNTLGQMASASLANKDNLSTRISYKLNLKGPSITMRTACSTSLVAIHLACRALLMKECDIALAGGVSIQNLEKKGYTFQDGLIVSPDGHCRPFDAKSNGTIFGNGAGVTVLKKLKNAIKDRDNIYAVIKGSAINNDGLRKVGYTAPSVEGQANVIMAAQKMAKVEPESIDYIETHGTATKVGDSIEMEALKLAFNTNKRNFCCLGFVKSNVGHLDTAAGVAGFIKTVLVLKNKLIPPAVHFETPHPEIDFENSPFYINREIQELKTQQYPLRAGVSSFGLGGTNAHVILEEAPKIEQNSIQDNEQNAYRLILLSAKKESALHGITQRLIDHFKKNPDLNLSDVAYTLQVGRSHFPYRKTLACTTIEKAISGLSDPENSAFSSYSAPAEKRPVIFMFSGQGSQYANMGLDLYIHQPVFRKEMDRCFEILKPLMDYDLKRILYPEETSDKCRGGSPCPPSDVLEINQTEISQPAIFAIEYSLTKLLLSWGIKPNAMIGHSIGEYTAACISGVFSLEDALMIVAIRGRLMQRMSSGSMLSVPLSEKELKPLLNENVELAAVNSSSLCVLSGTHDDIDAFAQKLKDVGCECRKLVTAFAFHSKMMDPMLERFDTAIKKFQPKKPDIPYISNLTGNWISSEDLKNPSYWTQHLRETVRFSDGLDRLFDLKQAMFVEVGPGNALNKFANRHAKRSNNQKVVNLMRHPQEKTSDLYFLLNKIGGMWMMGQEIDWDAFYSNQKRRRVSLPNYAFDKKYYWIEPIDYNRIKNKTNLNKKNNMDCCNGKLSWYKTSHLSQENIEQLQDKNNLKWLFFIDEANLGDLLIQQLKQYVQNEITVVEAGEQFSKISDGKYMINPNLDDDYQKLFNKLEELNKIPHKIVHLWGVNNKNETQTIDRNMIEKDLTFGVYSIQSLTQAMASMEKKETCELIVISSNAQNILGNETLAPGKLSVFGLLMTISQEYKHIKYRSIDLSFQGSENREWQFPIKDLSLEMFNSKGELFTAYRNNCRWVWGFHQEQPDNESVKESKIKGKEIPSVSTPKNSPGHYFKSISETENKILNIWKELLGHEAIGLNDNFFDLGGDSLAAVEVKNRVTETFNVEIPVVDVLHFPTVRSFVENFLKVDQAKDNNQNNQEKNEKSKLDFSDILNKF